MNNQFPPKELGTSQDDHSKWDSDSVNKKIISLTPLNLDYPRITSLRKQMADVPTQPVSSNVVRFTPDRAPPPPIRDVFETVRVINLSHLRLSLKRKRYVQEESQSSEAAHIQKAKADLIQILDALHKNPKNAWPDVVIIRRPNRTGLMTNHAVLSGTIYLGGHLSEDWTEGKEGLRFFVSLREALLDFDHMRSSRFEASASHF